jgi:hypothetical protein
MRFTRNTITGAVAPCLLLCSCVATLGLECGFGALCNKTVRMLFFPVRVCFNGSCSDNAELTPVSVAYFAPDGTVLTQFDDWWDIPGARYDTFVCRSSSSKSVSRSCYGASCQPDIIRGVLKSVKMTDSCSVAGNEDNLSITLLKNVHLYSKKQQIKKSFLDTDLRVQVNIKGMTEEQQSGGYRCDADIHASAQFHTPRKPPSDTIALHYEYDGAVNTAKVTGLCAIYDGNKLTDRGSMPGKVIDAGP